jgi:hypothetical protein
MGSSAIAWAQAVRKNNPQAKVFCIDTWLGSVEHYLGTCGKDWNIDRLSLTDYGPDFYDDFLCNVKQENLSDCILPLRAASCAVLPYLSKAKWQFDIIYIDGAHDTYSVFQDAWHSLSILSDKGIICGDDFDWSSVQEGLRLVALLKRNKNLKFFFRDKDFVLIRNPDQKTEDFMLQRGYIPWKAYTIRQLVNPVASAKNVFMNLLFSPNWTS